MEVSGSPKEADIPQNEANDDNGNGEEENDLLQEFLNSPVGSNNSRNSETENTSAIMPEAESKNSPSSLKSDNSLKRTKKQKEYEWVRKRTREDITNNKYYNIKPEKDKFYLKVSNFPTNWCFDELREYICKEVTPVKSFFVAADKDMCFIGMIMLEFDTFKACCQAWRKLHGKTLEDVKLFADTCDSDADEDSDSSSPPEKKRRFDALMTHSDLWDEDPNGLCGFKEEFLTSLCISPPIDRWVHVSNIRCDKSELKAVMELGGEVLICYTVDTKGPKYAKVMYSHPIEAVQAVSMLNNQQFYGKTLKVTMDKCSPGTLSLPKGLANIGPGLGINGTPLRDVVKQYERLVGSKKSLVEAKIFSQSNKLTSFGQGSDLTNTMAQNKNVKNNSNRFSSPELKNVQSRSNNLNISPNISKTNGKSISLPGVPGINDSGHSGVFSGPGSMSRSSSVSGLGPMSGPGPIGSQGPMSGPRPMGGSGTMGGAGTMGGPGSMGGPGPMGRPGTMGGPGPMCGPGSMGGPGPMSGPGSMGVPGPMGGPRFMGGPRPMGGPGPMGGPRPMGGPGPMGGLGPIGGPGPMGGPGPIGGPGPMSGSGPIGGPGPMGGSGPMGGPGHIDGPGLMSGPGPMGGPGPIGGPGPMGRPGPMGGPGPMNGPGSMTGPGNMFGSGGPMGPAPGPNFGQSGPMSGPNGPMSGPNGSMPGYQGPQNAMHPHPVSNNDPRPGGPNMPVSPAVNDYATVELSNLPLSTTFPVLCEKMAQCGQVVSLQLTSPGCAVVQFANRGQAQRCYAQYNQCCVLGNTIQVQFM